MAPMLNPHFKTPLFLAQSAPSGIFINYVKHLLRTIVWILYIRLRANRIIYDPD